MPRARRTEPPAIPPAAMVASATRFTGKNAPRIYRGQKDWQVECYRHYSICGEARFGAKFFGHAVSRAILNAAEVQNGVPTKVDQGPTADAVAALFNGQSGQEQMLELIGMHLTIAGECFLVGRTVDGVDVWEIVSILEMKVTPPNKWTIDYGNGTTVDLAASDVVIRIWLPSPERKMEADSPFKALLPILSEIEWLTRHVFAQVSSRLAGAGILFMPEEMDFPTAKDAQDTDGKADGLMRVLADAMMTPLSDPGSPSALIPITVTAPAEFLDKPHLMHFWSDLDENSLSMRSEAIRRFALGMDLPPEQILGMSSNPGTGGGNTNGVSHWGAWQIEEATIKLHVEPMLGVICDALTIGYLRPLLDDDTALIIYDTSALRLRPDRSKEAIELWDRGLLKSSVVLTENGFDPERDAPDDDEWRRWMLVKIAGSTATPDQVQAALKELGVNLHVVTTPGDTVPSLPSPQPPEIPTLEDHPTRPATPDAALLAASEALVFRALERAGNRLRQSGAKPPGVPSHETHTFVKVNGTAATLLDDAWATAPFVLDGIADPDKIVPVLNSYCESLLAKQACHERKLLIEWLRLVQ